MDKQPHMPLAAAGAAELAADTLAQDRSSSRGGGAAVLAIPALIARICTGIDSAADGANLRQSCKQTASSLDWFDLMWCARQDIPKVHTAITQHAPVIVPVARIKRTITGSLADVWSCPPLLKWVVLQAAKQGDAELLGAVLGRMKQPKQEKRQQQQQQPHKPQLQQAEQQQRQLDRQQQANMKAPCEVNMHNEEQLQNALRSHRLYL